MGKNKPPSQRQRFEDNKRKRGYSSEEGELSELNMLLENITKDNDKVESAVNLILKHQSLRHAITASLKTELARELSSLQTQIDHLSIKLDDQEQYSRRTNLKLSGIKERGREENTDDLVLDVINNLILADTGESLNYSHIGRTHRVGPPLRITDSKSKPSRPRDIIIRFISYRNRDLVFRNKKNLKTHNQSQPPEHRLYVNEALTKRRANLFKKTRDLLRDRKVKNCWTHDGKILVKSLSDRTIHISHDTDLEQFLKITVVPNPHKPKDTYVKSSNNTHQLNATAIPFDPPIADLDYITSTPLPAASMNSTTPH